MISRRKLRRLCMLHNIKTVGLPSYLCKLIPNKMHTKRTRNSDGIKTYQCRIEPFKFFFFLWTIPEWNKIVLGMRNSTYSKFRNHLLEECRPVPKLLYNVLKGVKLVTREK